MIKKLGYQPVLAVNGEDAIAKVEAAAEGNTPYDLVLMDVQMPVMDGLEATKIIREIPGLENVPIIALTGLVRPEDANRCLLAGANKHMSKPFGVQELIKTIGEFVPNVIR